MNFINFISLKSYFLIIFLIIITTKSPNISASYECQHPPVEITISKLQNPTIPFGRTKRATGQLRIYKYYDPSFSSIDNVDIVKTKVVEGAIAYWEKALVPKQPLQSPLLINRKCNGGSRTQNVNGKLLNICLTGCASMQTCFFAEVPQQFVGPCYISTGSSTYTNSTDPGTGAENSDLMIIITHTAQYCQANTLAYAAACQLEDKLNRPILGIINICPNKITLGPGISSSVQIIKHEIGHILGFSSSLYAFYRDSNGNPLTTRGADGLPLQKTSWSDSIYQYSSDTVIEKSYTFEYANEVQETKKISMLVTPAIMREVKSYFNCSTLEGAFLEDYGTTSNALSHFDKRVFQTELMTPVISTNGPLSRFSLAVMEDTGWYNVYYNHAENFVNGKSAGCDFVTTSCFSYMKTKALANQPYDPYCNRVFGPGALTCSADRSEINFCTLYNTNYNIPTQNRYFSNTNYISLDPYSDYCPYMQVYAETKSGATIFSGTCSDTNNNAVVENEYNQKFGSSSKCVNSNPSSSWQYAKCNTKYSSSVYGAGCYNTECSSVYGLLIVVNGLKYQCKTPGTVIDVTSVNDRLVVYGSLVCPNCSEICNSQICQSVSSTLSIPCNFYDRPCPASSTLSMPCTGSYISFRILSLFTSSMISVIYMIL